MSNDPIRIAVQAKIDALTEEIDELEISLERAAERRQLYIELLNGEETATIGIPKKRGRPARTKPVVPPPIVDPLYEEAVKTLPVAPTTQEEQEKAVARFRPLPRPQSTVKGVVAGPGKPGQLNQQSATPPSHIHVEGTEEE